MTFGPAAVPAQDAFFKREVVPFIDEAASIIVTLYAERRDPTLITPIRESVRLVMALARHIFEPGGPNKTTLRQISDWIAKGRKHIEAARAVMRGDYL